MRMHQGMASRNDGSAGGGAPAIRYPRSLSRRPQTNLARFTPCRQTLEIYIEPNSYVKRLRYHMQINQSRTGTCRVSPRLRLCKVQSACMRSPTVCMQRRLPIHCMGSAGGKESIPSGTASIGGGNSPEGVGKASKPPPKKVIFPKVGPWHRVQDQPHVHFPENMKRQA